MSEYIVDFKNAERVSHFESLFADFTAPIHEEIVRCRDCCLQNEFKYCDRLGFKVGDNGYCAWWKRRDADTQSMSKTRAIEGVLMYLIDSSNTVEFDAMTAIEKAVKDIMEIMSGDEDG